MRDWIRVGILIICLALAGLYLSRAIGLLDKPGPDIIPPRSPVPTLQGIFLYIAVVAAVSLFPDVASHPATWPLLLGGGAMVLLNFLDELLAIREANRQGSPYLIDVIPSRFKLIIQLVILGFVIYKTGLYEFQIMGIDLPLWLGAIGAMLRFLVFINAINRFDYAYGQASGLSAIGYASIVALVQLVVIPSFPELSAERAGVLDVVTVIGSIMIIASLVYTVIEYRPYGLLRDVGSWFYGFSLAYLALLGGAKIGTMLVVLSLPLFDFVRVIANRLFIMHKNPLIGDYTHLHHRLLRLGWNKSELRRFVRVRSAMMAVLMLLQGDSRWPKVIIFGMMAAIFFGVHIYLYRIKGLPYELTKRKKGEGVKRKRSIVYIDALNLYYGLLKNTPYKWLDLYTFVKSIYDSDIVEIKYFYAPIKHGKDPSKDQQTYIKALKKHISRLSGYEAIEGYFKQKVKKRGMLEGTEKLKIFFINEEKGTDVNIGCHIIHDATTRDDYDTICLVSNDTDLTESLYLAKNYKKNIILIPPIPKFPKKEIERRKKSKNDRIPVAAKKLKKYSSYVAYPISANKLREAQLPDDIDGISRPESW